MKKHITISVLLGLVFMNASVFAETKYGPVITVKPKGVQAAGSQTAGKPANPSAQRQVKSGEKPKTTGLLLPAVQKVRGAASRTESGKSKDKKISNGDDGTKIQGSLDRDIIRRIQKPSKPKPTK